MSYEEKREIVSIISAIIIFALYCIYVFQRLPQGGLDAVDPSFWGTTMLILVPVQVIPQIIIMILFNIITKITTGEEEPDASDEMEKLIELKALRSSYYLFIAGFFLAMITIAMGMSLSAMFITIGVSFITSGVFGLASKLYYYRRGV